MIVRYDKTVDAAYIYFEQPERQAQVAKTVPCDPIEIGAEINLDFDAQGRLIGIEVLGASRHLPAALLDDADNL
jgi:uncharacterized protein YuzE